MPQVVSFASLPALPDDVTTRQWTWIVVNLLLWSACGLLLASVLGHVAAASLLTCAFAGVVVVQQLLGPPLAWFPFASGWDPRPRWVIASLCAAFAVWFYVVRSSTASHEVRRQRNR